MTIEFRPPHPGEEQQLRALFTEAFTDAWFTDLFFSRGYSPERCFVAAEEDILAAMHWFDCDLGGKKTAYVYGIATFEAHRGRGIGSQLIRAGLEYLNAQGYEAVLLVPAEESLFGYYERFGFSTVSTIREETVTAGIPLPLRKLTVSEYAALRRRYLPANGVLQEGPALELLDGYADFYATDHALCAVSGRLVWELLGEPSDGPGILGALDIPVATVRTPGSSHPFAMGVGCDGPVYFGLALD